MRIIIAVLMSVLLSSCSYKGSTVDLSNDMVCMNDWFPQTCSYTNNDFAVKYTITHLQGAGQYEIEGTLDYLGGQTFTEHSQASFVLLIITGSTVRDEIHLPADGSLQNGFTFSKQFETKHGIDSTIVSYSMRLRG